MAGVYVCRYLRKETATEYEQTTLAMHQSGKIGDRNFADSAIAIPRHVVCSLSLGAMNISLENSGCQEQVRAPLRAEWIQ